MEGSNNDLQCRTLQARDCCCLFHLPHCCKMFDEHMGVVGHGRIGALRLVDPGVVGLAQGLDDQVAAGGYLECRLASFFLLG